MNSNDLIRKNIILPAWKIVKDDNKVKLYNLFPSLLSLIFLTAILTYQSIYTYVVVFGNTDYVLEKILYFFESKYVIEVIIIFVIFLIIYFLLVPIFEGGLIKYIEAKDKGNPMGSSDAFGYGLTKFLPFFEYDNLFSEFKLMSIMNFYLFTIRFVGIDYIKYITIVYAILFLLGITLNLIFSYAKYSIILNNKLVFAAIGESAKIVFLNLKITIKLFFMFFFFNLRIIINILIFLFFPILISIAFAYIGSQFVMYVTVGILVAVFVILILIVGYITSLIDIFRTAAWYFAYTEGRKKIDVEEDE